MNHKIFLMLVIAFALLIYLVKPILAPFVFSIVVAFFLNPFVNFLHKKSGISRLRATALITVLFLSIIISASVVIFPILYLQFSGFTSSLPSYFGTIYSKVENIASPTATSLFSIIQDANISSPLLNFSTGFVNKILTSSIAIINIFSIIFITPVLIFYLLKDWDVLLAKIDFYLPSKFKKSTESIAKEIDETLSGYVRGQIVVCLVLAFIYSIFLTIAKLNFGFLIGLLTGLFSFIPFVGALTGFVTAIAVAFFQWGFDLQNILLISSVFIFGQVLESNFLTPKLIGSRVGLHPVWIIFGLFLFGFLFGFLGILFATPLTAICGVLIKHFLVIYKNKFTSSQSSS
jgi:predicted PurR-regulated permease PerM